METDSSSSSNCGVVDEGEITTPGGVGVGVDLDLHPGRADLLFELGLHPPSPSCQQQKEEDLPVNRIDVSGNTPLHLAAAARLPQTLEELLGSKLMDVDALNSRYLTPLDVLYSSPCPRKIENEIKGILGRAGGLRAHEISTNHHQNNAREAPDHNHSPVGTKGGSEASTNLLLLLATAAAYVTYRAAFHLPAAASRDRAEGGISSLLSSYFVFGNSLVFVASVVTSISLLQSFPFKPWPQVSFVSLFCSYVLSIAAKSRSQGVVALLIFSFPCLVTAVLGKLHVFAKQPNKASPSCKLNYLSC